MRAKFTKDIKRYNESHYINIPISIINKLDLDKGDTINVIIESDVIQESESEVDVDDSK